MNIPWHQHATEHTIEDTTIEKQTILNLYQNLQKLGITRKENRLRLSRVKHQLGSVMLYCNCAAKYGYHLDFTHFHQPFWRRKWQPTPVFLPRESHGQRSLVGAWSQRVRHD